jgi:hypothetical protein
MRREPPRRVLIDATVVEDHGDAVVIEVRSGRHATRLHVDRKDIVATRENTSCQT